MSILKKPINFTSLENDLDNALKADELYQLRNDAKIRAIEQRVPTYDHFRDMVQAAHLRPLERDEMKKQIDVSWNHCLNKNKETSFKNWNESKTRLVNSKQKYDSSIANNEPQTSVQFLKIWCNLSDFQEKFNYLSNYRNQLKNKFFKAEVPSEFLHEFVRLSLQICSTYNVTDIVDILTIFSECNRFSLCLAMMSSLEKQLLDSLFKKLILLIPNDEDINRINCLIKSYCVSMENDINNKNIEK